MSSTKLYGKARRAERQQEAKDRSTAPREISFLWAGGWDVWLVDPAQIRDLTIEEINDNADRVLRGHASDPFCINDDGTWIRGGFVQRHLPIRRDQAVRAIRRIASGD